LVTSFLFFRSLRHPAPARHPDLLAGLAAYPCTVLFTGGVDFGRTIHAHCCIGQIDARRAIHQLSAIRSVDHRGTVRHSSILATENHWAVRNSSIPATDHHAAVDHPSISATDHHAAVDHPSVRANDHHWAIYASLRVYIDYPSTGVGRHVGRTGRVERASSRIAGCRTGGVTPTATAIGRQRAADIIRSPIPLGATVSSSSGIGPGHGRIIAAAADARNCQSQH
jgi:hypothetical protein